MMYIYLLNIPYLIVGPSLNQPANAYTTHTWKKQNSYTITTTAPL